MGPLEHVIARKPAYDGGSIVNLMASVIDAAGGAPAYPLLAELDVAALRRARHLVLVVIDGLGYELLRSVVGLGALHRHLAGGITSVFPPTTATAVTTVLTGLTPQEHGLTGWFMLLPKLGSVITVLPFKTRFAETSLEAAGVDARALLGHTPVFDLVARRSFCVSPHDIAYSAFNRAHTGRAEVRSYRTMDEFFASIERIVHGVREPTFTYAYWPLLDRLAHIHGVAHPGVQAHVAELDRRFERSLDAIAGTDTVVLATADHGFVDIEPGRLIRLSEHPVLKSTLLLPLCGEPRAAYCYVAPGREAQFVSYVEAELAAAAVCVPSKDLIEHGYLGRGEPHPELEHRIGHYALIMRERYAIVDDVPGQRPFDSVGVHGGGSTTELEVPLIVAMP